MSRSRRRLPIAGITCAESEKEDKRRWNRAFRKKAQRMLDTAHDYDGLALPIHMRKETELWDGEKDGKYWFRDPWAQLMRK